MAPIKAEARNNKRQWNSQVNSSERKGNTPEVALP